MATEQYFYSTDNELEEEYDDIPVEVIEEEGYVIPDEYKIEPVTEPPIPYDENEDPNPFWSRDSYDSVLPSDKGFITDLVYFFRGTEVPTLYTIWSALVAISAVVKREAWISWHPDPLFTNLYVILVGTAGLTKKTTAMSFLTKQMKNLQKYIKDPVRRKTKKIRIIKNKMTPESIIEEMNHGQKEERITDDDGKLLKDDNGNPLKYYNHAETLMMLPELAVSVNKKQYAETMISNLLDMYDPHDTWEYTRATQEKIILKNLHTNFIGATTPDGFASTIPSEATGDGFISRCVIVYQEMSEREFRQPRKVEGAPTEEELTKRLAWIAENAYGEYDFSPEAGEYLDKWYHAHKMRLKSDPEIRSIRSRMDIIIMKVAALLKMQSYSTNRIITLQDVQDAENLLDITYKYVPGLLGRISNRSGTFQNLLTRIGKYVKSRGTVSRKEMMQGMKIQASDLNPALEWLMETGEIRAWLGREVCDKPVNKSSQKYEYIGDGEGIV